MNTEKINAIAHITKKIIILTILDADWLVDLKNIGLAVVGAGIIAPILQKVAWSHAILTIIVGLVMMSLQKIDRAVTKALKKDSDKMRKNDQK